jgi:hypothetical protein
MEKRKGRGKKEGKRKGRGEGISAEKRGEEGWGRTTNRL